MISAFLMGDVSPDLTILPEGTSFDFSSFIRMTAFATLATLWAYEGWINLNTVSEEMKKSKEKSSAFPYHRDRRNHIAVCAL